MANHIVRYVRVHSTRGSISCPVFVNRIPVEEWDASQETPGIVIVSSRREQDEMVYEFRYKVMGEP